MLSLLRLLRETLHPLLVPLCFVLAWSFILFLGWTLWSAIQDTTKRAQKMHQIPCTHCQFFTNNYRLKCTVQPSIANTEQAINCQDYHPNPQII